MILTRPDGGRFETRTANLAGLGIQPRALGSAGVPVTPTSVAGIPAYNRAVRIAAEAVASLRMRVWRGQGMQRKAVDTVWQARLFRDALNDQQSRFGFWETTETSLSKRGNAYWWVNTDPVNGRATEIYALHPDQVFPIYTTGMMEYHVAVAPRFVDPVGKGFGFYTKDDSTILHIRGFDNYGLIAPSPIEVYREALGVGVARLRHESNSYGKGAALRGVVTMPPGVTQTEAEKWRDMWRDTYENGGETTGILGGGATFAPISMTMADSQFIESQEFGVAEAARIVGVPSSMLDEGGRRGQSTPITPEHELMRWMRFGLGGRLERIESAMLNCPALFPYGSSVEPGFDTDKFVRGDLATEAQIALSKVQSGQWLVDEARALDGLEPLPNGAGQVPQIVPVGGGANPVPTPISAGDAPKNPPHQGD